MLGYGNWLAKIDTMFYTGDALLKISGTADDYQVELELPGNSADIPDFRIFDVSAEGDTLICKAEVSAIPGKYADISLTFEDDTCNGFIKVPFLGKIRIKDAKRVD